MKRFLSLLVIFCLFALPCHAAVTGSVSLANARLSLVNGTAFVDFSAAGTLTPYIGGKLTITDSAGKKAIGYIKAAGSGETFGLELIINGTFDSNTAGWSPTNATLASVVGGQSNNCLEITRTGGTSQDAYSSSNITTIAGASYLASVYIKSGTSGNEASRPGIYSSTWAQAHAPISCTSSASWVQNSFSRTLTTNASLFLLKKNTSTAGTMLFDEVSLKQRLTPSATGVTITSTAGGTVYNWTSIEAGFNYNDAAGYTYTIAPRFVGGGLGMGIIYGF